MSSYTEHPDEPPKRSFMNILLMLVMFYLAVFAALTMLDFQFPLTILYTLFFLIAVPFGLVVVGGIHLIYLIRLRMGSEIATPPQPGKLASLFVGTTVVVCAYFVSVYPQWRQAASETWATTIAQQIPDTVPTAEREALSRDVQALWLKYWQLIEVEGTEAAENHPELTEAFQHMVSAATRTEPMREQDYRTLRALVPTMRPVSDPATP